MRSFFSFGLSLSLVFQVIPRFATAEKVDHDYSVHTHCVFRNPSGRTYEVHIKTQADLGDWKAKMDLSYTDSLGQKRVLESKVTEYIQHTAGETFRGESMRLEIEYVDRSVKFPGAERGVFTATLDGRDELRLDGMSCIHAVALARAREIARFHSANADEYEVRLQAVVRTEWKQLDIVRRLNDRQKEDFKNSKVFPVLKFLYGPLTHREWGSPQRDFQVEVSWDKATVEAGRVHVPYSYKATWILHREIARRGNLEVPVPYSPESLMTPRWKGCTDFQADHQTPSFFWYFWDPERRGCEHKLGEQYQLATVTLGRRTVNQSNTFPEYSRLIRNGSGGEKKLAMTFAFGYVTDPSNPHPDTDQDLGAREYQEFLSWIRQELGREVQETEIKLRDYGPSLSPEKVIGHRFLTRRAGVRVSINVVAAADIDQMDLFAKSFAQDHESFFSWFGHSRVGSGFDAEVFASKLKQEPERYSITKDYQLIYWAGCNSYSYYTVPFFQLKANSQDPIGTKGLDIISNGLPSYFVLNAENAKITFKHLYAWEKKASYQQIIRDLETAGQRKGLSRILINVLGDEDNSRNL